MGRWTHRYCRKIFQGSLLPGIVDKPLPLAVQRILWMGRTRCLTVRSAIFARQVEETGGSVISEDTLLIQLQPPEGPCQALSKLSSRVRAVARGRG